MLNGFAPVDGRPTSVPVGARVGLVGVRAGVTARIGIECRLQRGVFSSADSGTSPSSVGGEGSRSFLVVGKWDDISVGEMYPPELDGPGLATAFPASDNSLVGVMGGGGGNGGGDDISPSLNRDDGRFSVARFERFGQRDRRVRRPGVEVT